MSKPYIVTEYRKTNVHDEYYSKKIHRFSTAREAIENFDLIASVAEKDLNDGKIVDFQIEI